MSRQTRKINHRLNQARIRYKKHRQRNQLAEPGVNDFVVILDHLKGGYNVPKIFRTAQAFGAREVHLINVPPFDPAPAKGAFKYVPAKFYDNFEQCYQQLLSEGYTFYVLEPGSGIELAEASLDLRAAFIFGNEELGIQFNITDYPEIKKLNIKQHGFVDSLNVSIAASIVMYEYCCQYRK